ncbi:integral membrane protein [Talaromyces stipitatus ATCC 10500]|uniref:Integral membrane protein n=1 Tax=Talaromyces stipitatus (strain ATCC 10500 / CBS 375.48 / QM 6759 / NRRL 1006) TaxID=441959 RepID=B8MGY7_TALSN|nr:uncharacterized protein TSTA_014600 [Talaromyces stipitatus ATCC 10500]EED16368.1 integral membrane protein [Talaromyces stipitatus ATCC 10500]
MAPSARGWEEIKIGIALSVLATIAVFLRFVARFVKKVKLGTDDWLALASLILISAMLIELIICTLTSYPSTSSFSLSDAIYRIGAAIGNSGKHLTDLDTDEVMMFYKTTDASLNSFGSHIFLVNEFTYAVASPLVKLTIIFFYRRLFISSGFRTIINMLFILCIIWAAVAILGFALQCRPLARQWDMTVSGTCDDQIAFIESIQGINIFLDASIFAVPWPMIWKLHRPWQDKVGLSGIFLLGGL